ncbi:hypothetical protein Fot_08632 [Forsythia ovata]|uniref:Uncharacterized protein n=1 Tax=Forsythia ovata TaxID=205694 RepID=A0ABD1WZ85_9LAMI
MLAYAIATSSLRTLTRDNCCTGGYMPTLLLAPRMESSKISLMTNDVLNFGEKSHSHVSKFSAEPSRVFNKSMSTISKPTLLGASSDYTTSNLKKRQFAECTKGARGEQLINLRAKVDQLSKGKGSGGRP